MSPCLHYAQALREMRSGNSSKSKQNFIAMILRGGLLNLSYHKLDNVFFAVLWLLEVR